jgi:hypothetical protein
LIIATEIDLHCEVRNLKHFAKEEYAPQIQICSEKKLQSLWLQEKIWPF